MFAGRGETVLTDRVSPDPASEGVALYTAGGAAKLVSLGVWELKSAWTARGAR